MPRNSDESLEWPDEESPRLSEVLKKLDLEMSDYEDIQPDLQDKQPFNHLTED